MRIKPDCVSVLLILMSSLSQPVSGQSYSPLYPPRSTQQFTLQCWDGGGFRVYGTATYWADYYPNTNGHFHTSPAPPLPTFSPQFGAPCWSTVSVTFTPVGHALKFMSRPATLFAVPTIQNLASGFPSNSGNVFVDDPIYWVTEHDIIVNNQAVGRWKHVGGNTTQHGGNEYNHWMTQGAANGLWYAINDYVAANPSQTTVCINDMALPYGGKFDLDRNWTSPHRWHDRGKAVDVPNTASNACSTQASGGIPHGNAWVFERMCLDKGAIDERTQVESNHVHCNWADSFTPVGG